jgi:uncharacterized protein (DUF1810 family)
VNQSNFDDPYDLARFVAAQEDHYDRVLAEIRFGKKTSHWMWYIFPQFEGLGTSAASRRYAIKSLSEARAYLAHPVLGERLLQCAEATLSIAGRTATAIFGSPDDQKLRSSATLFAAVAGEDSVFQQLLAKYFDGKRDDLTLRLISGATGESS